MAIKVVFPAGTASISVGGLFQWDYGQVLEIESAEIGSEIVEVHFACSGMSEAIVRPCTFANGVGTVTIPDQCLEQSNTITAWIYEIEGAQGRTIKTITLPIIARARPAKSFEVPAEYVDKYAELLTEINQAVDAIENGSVKAASAKNADAANYATTAGNAQSAAYATSAGHATTADKAVSADNATNASNANSASYATNAGYATKSGNAESASHAASATKANVATKIENIIELIKTVKVWDGTATPPTETRYNKPCLVVFDTGIEVNCGVYYEKSSAQYTYTKIGNFMMRNDGSALTFTDNTGAPVMPSGNMYFYQLGGASQ